MKSCDEGLSVLGNPSARRREFRKLLKRLADGDGSAQKTVMLLIDRYPDCGSEPEWKTESEALDQIMLMPAGTTAQSMVEAIKAGVAFSKSKLLEQRQCRSA
jgi:hypothetical protein